jgi:predicted RecA/RadA family phage recombinase
MAETYRGYGRSINIPAPAGGVLSGNGYMIGGAFGVAGADANVGELFAYHLEGIYVFPKPAGALAVGTVVYWDQQLNNVSTASTSGHVKIGIVSAAATSAAAFVEVRLNGAF